MAKTIAIVGFGPGTATAVAEKFGAEGFSVAAIGRSKEHLDAGVAALKGKGINASAFVADAGDTASIRAAIRAVRAQLGTITVLHWNAYTTDAGDLLAADDAALHRVFEVSVIGMLAALDEALPDLKQNGSGALMVSNGGFGVISPEVDEMAAQVKAMGLALSSGAKHKLVGLLAARLKNEGVYVGEVMVRASIKGTPGASGSEVDARVVAAKHWELYQARGATRGEVRP